MRRPYTKKPEAMFHEELPNITFAVRKDGIEFIHKIRPGVYIVCTLARTGDKEGVLIMNCDEFLRTIQENLSEELDHKLKENCPTFFNVINETDKDNVIDIETWDKNKNPYLGIALEVELPKDLALLFCISKDLTKKAYILFNKMDDIYREFFNNSPLPELKYALRYLWEQ